MSTKKADTAQLSGLDLYMQALYKSRPFPGVGNDSSIYLNLSATARGNAAVANRKYFNTSAALAAHFALHFPQGAMHTVSSPEVRALAHKVENPLTTMFGVSPWSEEQKQLAAKEFEVPSGTRILLMFPEIFDRDILLKDLKFHCKYTDIKGKPQTGVKTPCPWCNSNAHVVFSDNAGYKGGQHCTVADFWAKIPIYCFIAICKSPTCIGNPKTAKNDGRDNTRDHSFHCYEPRVFSQYPVELQEKYGKHLYTNCRDGADGSMFVTEELCSEVLKDETNFSELTRHMEVAYEQNLRQTITAYVCFIKPQLTPAGTAWPDFGVANFEYVFKPPSASTLKDVFNKAFQLVYPFLKQDFVGGSCVLPFIVEWIFQH
jgi:hypothetical protein